MSGTDGDHRGDTWGDRDQDPEIWDQLSCTTHQESPLIGVINGATIMAPMIAGALFANKPSPAMAFDSPSRKKKLSVGIDAAFIAVAVSSLPTLGSIRARHSPVSRRIIIRACLQTEKQRVLRSFHEWPNPLFASYSSSHP